MAKILLLLLAAATDVSGLILYMRGDHDEGVLLLALTLVIYVAFRVVKRIDMTSQAVDKSRQ